MWKILRFCLGMEGQPTYCPHCGSSKIHLSRRAGILEKTLFRALAVRPYRCEECDERYFNIGPRCETSHTFNT